MYDYITAVRGDMLQFLEDGGLRYYDWHTKAGKVSYRKLKSAMKHSPNLKEACTGKWRGGYDLDGGEIAAGCRLYDAMGDFILYDALLGNSELSNAVELDCALRESLLDFVIEQVVSSMQQNFGNNLDLSRLDILKEKNGEVEEPRLDANSHSFRSYADLKQQMMDDLSHKVDLERQNQKGLLRFADCKNRADVQIKLWDYEWNMRSNGNYDPKTDLPANFRSVLLGMSSNGPCDDLVEDPDEMLIYALDGIFSDVVKEYVQKLDIDQFLSEVQEAVQTADKAAQAKTASGLESRIAAAQHACDKAESKTEPAIDKSSER